VEPPPQGTTTAGASTAVPGSTPPPPPADAAPAAQAPVQAAMPAASATDAPLTIEIVASGECWTVLTIDGTRVMARILDPGEHVSYPVRSFATINAGNAGALSLTLNGKPARAIGAL